MNFLFSLVIAIILVTGMSAQTDKSVTAIRKIMDDQAAAWNRADLEAFMSIGYWRSDKLKFVSGDRITYGWQQTLDNYRKTYGGTSDKMGILTFSELEIEILSKDAAFVTGSWHLKREKDDPKGKFTLLFRKFKEGWRIVADHSS